MDELASNVVCRCCLNANNNEIKEYFDMKAKVFYSNQLIVNAYECYCEITGYSTEQFPNIPATATIMCDICLVQLQIAYAFREASRLANITLNQQHETTASTSKEPHESDLFVPMHLEPQSFTVVQDNEAFSIQLLDSDNEDGKPDSVVLVDESEAESEAVAEDESTRTSLSENNEEGGDFHKCQICYILFWDKAELKEHSASFHSNHRFKCEKCQKTFRLKSHHSRHAARKEDCLKLKCTNCSIVFSTFAERHEHMKEHAVKEFKCKICDMIIPSRRGAAEHRSRHKAQAKLRPFCAICDCEFDDKGQLLEHRQEKHPVDAAADTFKEMCRSCPEKFATKVLLLKHIRECHRHKCGKCPEIFSSYGQLREHRDAKHTVKTHGRSEAFEY